MKKEQVINPDKPLSISERIRQDREVKRKTETTIDFSEADTIDAKSFFIENNPNGYMLIDELKPYVANLPDWNFQQLSVLFTYMSAGYRINTPLYERENIFGLPSYWLKFGLPNGDPKLNVILTSSLDRFFNDYQQRKIKVAFTLEDLYLVADRFDDDKKCSDG